MTQHGKTTGANDSIHSFIHSLRSVLNTERRLPSNSGTKHWRPDYEGQIARKLPRSILRWLSCMQLMRNVKCKNLSQLQPASCQGAIKSKSDVHCAKLRVALGQPLADTSMHDYSGEGGGGGSVTLSTF